MGWEAADTAHYPDGRKVARADEWGGLESRCGLRVTVGSNPTPSARLWQALPKQYTLSDDHDECVTPR